MSTIVFSSTPEFLAHDKAAGERACVEIQEYVEGTYSSLRHGAGRGMGLEFAAFIDGAWQLNDGRRFCGWTIDTDDATISCTSSDTFLDDETRGVESCAVDNKGRRIVATGKSLADDAGRELMHLAEDGSWQLPNGGRFSDWASRV